jgi:hypothetical protein
LKKFLILASISILLFFSCSINVGLVFDDSVPLEQSAEIYTSQVGTVTGYNGISVEWKTGMSETVQIPAGDTLLEFDVKAAYGSTVYTGKGMLFRYNFQPQKRYFLRFAWKYEDGMNIYGLNVYTYDAGEKVSASNKEFVAHLTAFIPFLGTQGSQRTVLD